MKINLSQVKSAGFGDAEAFAEAVKSHIAALVQHRSTHGAAVPVGHAFVEHAVKRVQYPIEAKMPDDFVPDFEVVDDRPSLDEQKAALANQVQQAGQRLLDIISPPLKRRLTMIDVGRAQAVPVDERTSDHIAKIQAEADRSTKLDAVHYHLATLESQIHDLTEDTIGQWQPEPFPA